MISRFSGEDEMSCGGGDTVLLPARIWIIYIQRDLPVLIFNTDVPEAEARVSRPST